MFAVNSVFYVCTVKRFLHKTSSWINKLSLLRFEMGGGGTLTHKTQLLSQLAKKFKYFNITRLNEILFFSCVEGSAL